MTVSFRVDFTPVPWKRPGGTTQRFDSQVADKNALGTLVWQNIRHQLPSIQAEPLFRSHQAVSVYITFGIEKPKSSKLEHPTNKLDVDNLAKFVLDTLQSGPLFARIWHDDGQIVELNVLKTFAEKPFIDCLIKEFNP